MKYVELQKLTYVDYKCSRTVGLQYLSCKYYNDAFVLGSITIAYILMTMHDIMNIAGGDECSRAYVWRRPPVPPTSGHL